MALVRFLISGFLNTAITYFIYLGFLEIYTYQISYTLSFILGVFISYGLNALFVFKSGLTLSSLIRFPFIYLVQYLLGIILVSTLVEFINIEVWIAPIFAMMITIPITFVLSRIIFTTKKK